MVGEVLVVAIGVSLFFSFWNGFTDAANAISTIVATRVLRPVQAVGLSAVGNFIGMFFGVAVATTIGKGIISSDIVSAQLVIAALVGGLLWDVFTWWLGLPVSESHVLIGGLVGAGAAAGGFAAVKWQSIIDKVLIPMVTSPTIALVIAFAFTVLTIRAFRHYAAARVNRVFGSLQILSSLFFSVMHGTNDAQKVMGIITALLVSYGLLGTFDVPFWVIVSSHAAISMGTFFGGWRIVRTMAMKITHLRPYQGFTAEASGALILGTTASLGFPVSTTHAISGAIMGVGATMGARAVRWVTARRIIWTWMLTMPAAAFFAYFVYLAMRLVAFVP